MRAALPLPDPPQVLLHRRAVAGQPEPLGPGTRGQAVGGTRARLGGGRAGTPAGPAPHRTPPRHDDPVRVRREGIDELELQPDDRVQAGRLGRGRESDGAVEAAVVSHGEGGEPELDRPLDQVVHGRRAVEEREVRVAVQLGVGREGHRRADRRGRECVAGARGLDPPY